MNKPCPFKHEKGLSPAVEQSHQFGILRVRCSYCHCTGPWSRTEAEAWAAWNTRPVEDAALEACRELVATAIKDQPLKLRYHIEFADGTVYYPANTIDPIADKARKVVEE